MLRVMHDVVLGDARKMIKFKDVNGFQNICLSFNLIQSL